MRHLMTGRFFGACLVGAFGVGILAGGTVASLAASPEGHPATGVITEDSPGWDCATMGNRVCGPSELVVTRHEGATHIVTGDGRLIIVPADRAECVRVALPSAEFAECVPEG